MEEKQGVTSPAASQDTATTHELLNQALTKMDWNNNTLYKKLPVTLIYSKAVADILQQNPQMVDRIYDFRCFM